MALAPTVGGIERALRHRDFRLYWFGASGSFIGTWVYRTGLGWFTWELTHSTAWLGIVSLVEVMPVILLVPFTGAVTDRVGALRIAKVAQLLATAMMSLLAVLTALDLMTRELLLVLVLGNGLIMAANQPSYFALVGTLVPREDLSAAIGLQSVVVQSARFIGPALGGVVLVRWGAEGAFAVNAASYLCLFAALLMVRFRDARQYGGWSENLLGDVAQAARYIWGHYAIRTILALTILLAVLLRPVMELMPGFASDVFGRGAGGLAWLMSAAGLGAIFGSLWIAERGTAVGLTRIFAGSTLATAVVLLGFVRTDTFWVGVVLIALFGLASNVNSICSQILVQTAVAPEMRARVMSIVGLTFRAVPAISAGVLGWLAELYGLALPFSVTAVLGFVAGLWLFRLLRRPGLAAHAEAAPDAAPQTSPLRTGRVPNRSGPLP